MTTLMKSLFFSCLVALLCTGCVYKVNHSGDSDCEDWEHCDERGSASTTLGGDRDGRNMSDDCGDGCLVCVFGSCEVYADAFGECGSDPDCGDETICLGGECLLCDDDCSGDSDCFDGFRCSSDRFCIPSDRCRDSADCVGSDVCAPNGRCSTPLTPPSDSNTNGDNSAEDCPDSNATCKEPHCVFDNQCGSGASCIDGACRSGCSSSSQCGAADACIGGRCLPDPNGGSACLYNADCGDGVCENGYCFDRCSEHAQCGSGFCDAGTCRTDTRPQPECRASAECADAEVCSDARCRLFCTCDEDCPSANICDGGACIPNREASPQCMTRSDCGDGHCVDGICL